MMKRTPLYEAHRRAGARLIEFGGWEMPVQYTGITEEHLNVRQAAGLFDISHMGEFRVSGPGAQALLNHALTNDNRKLAVGGGQYTLMCNERGGVVDDLYAYRTGETDYLLVVNASRIAADFAWLQGLQGGFNAGGRVDLEDVSELTGAVAVQGPRVAQFIDRCFPGPSASGTPVARVSQLQKNQLCGSTFEGSHIWVARTGYTGEDGFEIIAPAALIEAVWERLLSEGKEQGLKPAGLGARDTLRTEMGYPLYGHELDEATSPLEAGLGFFVALDKGDFVGREALLAQKRSGVSRRLVGFKMTERSAPPRPQYPIWSVDEHAGAIGRTVSGTQSPSLNIGIGLGYVPPEFSKPQTPIAIEIRGRRYQAVVTPKPLYRKPD